MSANFKYPKGGIIPLPYHHTMLGDTKRSGAFEQAIARVVRHGSVVFDLGSGSGLLSYFAAKQAKKVYAVEADPQVAALGKHLMQLNGLTGKVDYTEGWAQDHLPPEPVDVVVCEMMHVALVEEQQIPVLNSVRRHLEEKFPGHPFSVVPQAAVNYVQLIQNNWDYYGFKAPFPRMGSAYVNDPYALPLSAPVPYLTVDFNQPCPTHLSATVPLEMTGYGTANAVRLTTQTVVAYDESLPEADRLIEWYTNFLILPLDGEYEAEPRARFTLTLDYDAGCPTDEIKVTVTRG